jgi:hypothetical protein
VRAELAPAHLIAAAQTLLADRVTGELVEAFGHAEIDPIVLRGPSIARHLYERGEARLYTDVDLLVRPDAIDPAGCILGDQGFVRIGEDLPGDRPSWARIYLRKSDGGNVDLHRTLAGAEAEPETVWAAMIDYAVPIVVAERKLSGLDAGACGLVVALHAAHHGAEASRQVDELSRAIKHLPPQEWDRARALADRIAATPAFAAGLRLLPEGAEIATRLGLPDDASTDVILRAAGAPPLALGFDWLSQTDGLRPKLRLIASKALPSPTAVKAWAPFARRGRFHLALAYAWRPLWLALHAPGGYRAWAKARRNARP